MTDAGFALPVTIAVAVAVTGEVLSIAAVVHLLTRRGATAATLNWVLIILFTPYIGLLLYYLLPRKIQLRRLKRRATQTSHINPPLDHVLADYAACDGSDPLLRLACHGEDDAYFSGNRLELIETGPQATRQMTRAIDGATEFVHFETYIFRPDDTGLEMLAVLTRAAARGVEVRLVYDSLGSFSLRQRHLAALRAAGGHACAYFPLLWRRRPFTINLRNHRKLLVVDGQQCFLGGRNVGDEYAKDRFGRSRRWWDAMVRVVGPGVAGLQRVFVEDWYVAAEEDLAETRYFPSVRAAGSDRIAIVASGPDRIAHRLEWVLLHMFSTAAHSIDISSPYLIPNPTIMTALQVAAARGVRVRIHTNGREVENAILHRAQRSYYRQFAAAGIEICESTADYNHTKLVLTDGRRLFVGSPNLDIRSSELNFEIAIATVDAAICSDALAMFEQRIAEATPVRIDQLDHAFYDPLANGICRLMSPLL